MELEEVLGKYVPAATTVDPSTPTARDGTPCDFAYIVNLTAERCAAARAAPIGSGWVRRGSEGRPLPPGGNALPPA